MLDNAGYSVPVLIEKHIAPKLSATVTKLAAEGGKFTDFVELEDHDTQLKAADMMLRMHGAYAPKDPKEAAHFGVKVMLLRRAAHMKCVTSERATDRRNCWPRQMNHF